MQLLFERRALAVAPAKSITRISDELFTSLFVLNSEFKFAPVVEKAYWLYRQKQRYRLSPVAPQEWGDDRFGDFIGECTLHDDMVWSLALSQSCLDDRAFMQWLEAQKTAFEKQLKTAARLDQALPGYQSQLPYYQRAYCSALSFSLYSSMQQAGIAALDYRRALIKSPD